MALSTERRTLAVELERALDAAIRIKRVATNDANTMAARSVSWSFLRSLLENAVAEKAQLDQTVSVPGIAAYAQEQLGEDVSADFTAMRTALDDVVQHLVGAIPKDGSDRLLVQTFSAEGEVQDISFSPAQTSTARGLLATLAATIE